MIFKHRAAVLAIVPTVAAGSLLIAAMPASADTLGCATRAEYRTISKGMSKARVASILDTSGKRMSYVVSGSNTAEMRNYRTCLAYSSLVILYSNGRLANKAATWVYV